MNHVESKCVAEVMTLCHALSTACGRDMRDSVYCAILFMLSSLRSAVDRSV